MNFPELPSIYSPESLRAFLVRHYLKGDIAGIRGAAGQCPASRWLRHEIGLRYQDTQSVAVTPWVVRVDDITYRTPEWLRAFQRGIDALKGEITARKAITVLLGITQDEQHEEAA